LTGNGASEDAEPRRLALASDLRWLINEGYVIEFNDGSLDRTRMKSKQQQKTVEALVPSALAVDATAATTLRPLQLTWREPQQLL
jgi:4-hydroxy-3-methylbut-2-en-1-yl diphosphate synthase IspG/GcpE